ncbi:AraC family transcriptional regulator, ethanolamine operon transcriptional activator [Marinobacterium iners DSM 11526]|jgi:AraC family ethanolamine operon transcriptional activator|uniref:AraC family transcriptional regulator, ethanolamine operon transcriptional activator n=1 Tax=Marinobacterium iners DSM 11526 TaxID=1122198 RepID=A0A1H4FN51_9GAMM|nr:AraC family transcriptional regulator, ethanolamine operon transcriptional activator [Marinobacterium iners DSM 11526]
MVRTWQNQNTASILDRKNNKEAKVHQNKQKAPQRCISVSDDINEQAFHLTDWSQEYNQYSSGRFQGRVEECQFDGIQLINEYTNQALHQHCMVWPDAFWLGIPTNREHFRINGQSVEQEDLLWRHGSTPFELVTPADCNIFSIVVQQEELFGLAARQGIATQSSVSGGNPRLRGSRHQVEELSLLVTRILAAADEGMDTEIHKDLLIQQLLNLLDTAEVNERVIPSYRHRKAVVDRVREYVDAKGDLPVTMTALCDLACVSRRTLQYSFESILGISPVQFLRATRLNRVRRKLLSAEGTSISDAAASQGFYHLSQFATDYRRLFGERPSETLRRIAH